MIDAKMLDAKTTIRDDDARAIAELSAKLKVPEHEVVSVFRTELSRLAEKARIPNFLSVLAISSTKSILHRRQRSQEPSC